MSKLAFPAGARPHVPVDHIAGHPVCSFIMLPGGLYGIDLTDKAKLGARYGSQDGSYALDGAIGPSLVSADTLNMGFSFSGKPSPGNTPWTIATIIRMHSAYGAGNNALVGLGASADGGGFYIRFAASTGVLSAICPFGTSQTGSGISPDLNAPMFVAVSNSPAAGACNFFMRRLDTGAIKSATTANCVATGGDGVVTVCAESGRVFNGRMHCGWVSLRHISMQELRVWADDPWSAWYDRP